MDESMRNKYEAENDRAEEQEEQANATMNRIQSQRPYNLKTAIDAIMKDDTASDDDDEDAGKHSIVNIGDSTIDVSDDEDNRTTNSLFRHTPEPILDCKPRAIAAIVKDDTATDGDDEDAGKHSIVNIGNSTIDVWDNQNYLNTNSYLFRHTPEPILDNKPRVDRPGRMERTTPEPAVETKPIGYGRNQRVQSTKPTISQNIVNITDSTINTSDDQNNTSVDSSNASASKASEHVEERKPSGGRSRREKSTEPKINRKRDRSPVDREDSDEDDNHECNARTGTEHVRRTSSRVSRKVTRFEPAKHKF